MDREDWLSYRTNPSLLLQREDELTLKVDEKAMKQVYQSMDDQVVALRAIERKQMQVDQVQQQKTRHVPMHQLQRTSMKLKKVNVHEVLEELQLLPSVDRLN